MPMRHLTVTGMRTRRAHGGDACGDQIGLGHQAGAEAALLHAVRRTADVEVDLVVAEAFADGGGLGELCGIGAAELQRDGMLVGCEAEQARAIAVQDGVGGDHLGVEERMAREPAMEGPAVPVRPIHHRGDAELYVLEIARIFLYLRHVRTRMHTPLFAPYPLPTGDRRSAARANTSRAHSS